MAIVAIHNVLFLLCLIKADTASDAIPMIALNTSPSVPLLPLVVCSNFGNIMGMSSTHIL